ncbi:MAG: hypothetical protein KKD39_08885 [Candidatus Altiarchaeota archaeon]|nr:hypothetical protein [Candidatus Altiarchaeota archaeon]
MLKAIRHRGTHEGTCFGTRVSLGSRRLPIFDLEDSSQPIFNEDKIIVLVGNGEIYNFRELNSELEARGHSIRTYGDLEYIVHLYEQHGVDFWNKLRGMFAVALYDIKEDTLLLSRYHLGIKPLFYRKNASSFLFSLQ